MIGRLLYLMIICVLLFTVDGLGQNTWVKTYGGKSGRHEGYSIKKDIEGNILTLGVTSQTEGDFEGLHKGKEDILLIKLDSLGNEKWKVLIGGSNNERGTSICPTKDSGYVITGFTFSTDGDFADKVNTSRDLFVIKCDKNGKIEWKNIIGGLGDDSGISIYTNTNEDIILLGTTNSTNIDFNELTFGNKYSSFLIKFNSKGIIIWKQMFLDMSYPGMIKYNSTLTILNDLSIVVTGTTQSKTFPNGDIIVMRLDNDGVILWKNTFEGDNEDNGISITSNTSNEIYVTGSTVSTNNFFQGLNYKHKKFSSWGFTYDTDIFLIKLNKNGEILWKYIYGGSMDDDCYGIVCSYDNNLFLTGTTSSNNGIFKNLNNGSLDLFLLKIDSKGKIQSKKTIGGEGVDYSNSIDIINGNSIILTGYTNSIISVLGIKKGLFVLKTYFDK
jgi:hypothetical protein